MTEGHLANHGQWPSAATPTRNLYISNQTEHSSEIEYLDIFYGTTSYWTFCPEWNLVPHSTAQQKKCCAVAVLYLKTEFRVL